MVNEDEEHEEATVFYKIKTVQFLGRPVPIILQNDNGPCPLIAICNVLLLRNDVSMSSDLGEISLQDLLSHVAERLLDSNSNVENKDDDYLTNQQQNISDAMPLLPRLAKGINVNVRFRHIHDFEFTPECAIFDLLDISLVHGWLFDPQDEQISKVIADNSYNVLVEKLVALRSQEPTVDFAAATTASLGIPSPSLSFSRMKSLEDIDFTSDNKIRRKGDDEEAAQLLRALQLTDSSRTGNTWNEVAGDGLLSEKQQNHESLSRAMLLETHMAEDDADDKSSSSADHSIGSHEIPIEEASGAPLLLDIPSGDISESSSEAEQGMTGGSLCQSISLPGPLLSTLEVGKDLTIANDMVPFVSENELLHPLDVDNSIDFVDMNSKTQVHLLADRMKGTCESSTCREVLNVEAVPSDAALSAKGACLPSDTEIDFVNLNSNSERSENLLAARTSLSGLNVQDVDSGYEDLERKRLNTEKVLQNRDDAKQAEVRQSAALFLEDNEKVLDSDGSRLSPVEGSNLVELANPVEVESSYASNIEASAGENLLNLDKQVSVDNWEISNKQNLLEMSAKSNAGTDLLEKSCQEDANEAARAHASASMEEPLYEGETMLSDLEVRHPDDSMELLYEGELVLSGSAGDHNRPDVSGEFFFGKSNSTKRSVGQDEHLSISASEGYIIENFLLNHASQLTYHGLFCLQEGLKERELCVFFRNNHFSTIFKYEGDLYLLVTDQGYLNQTELVWEKLTEVDGNSIFCTGNFTLFKPDENHGTWNEQDALAATAGFISAHQKEVADIQDAGQLGGYSTDLQLAMALQQEELDQQQQPQHQRSHISSSASPQKSQLGIKPSTGITAGRLFTGPKASTSAPKVESKMKDKCIVM